MAELADALDLGSNSERSVGSSPISRTILNEKGLLQNLQGKQQPFLFCHYIHLKDASRLKGDICGNSALQGGGRNLRKTIRLEDGPRLEDVTSLDGGSSQSSVFRLCLLHPPF